MRKLIILFFALICFVLISSNASAFYTSRVTTDKDSYYKGETVYVSYEIDCGVVSTIDNVRVIAQYGSSTNYDYDGYITLSYIEGETWGKDFSFLLTRTGEVEIKIFSFDNSQAVSEALKTISVEIKYYTVTVYVKDSDGNPIQDAEISFSKIEETDSIGKAIFSISDGSSPSITISKDGYETLIYRDVQIDEDTTLQYTLIEKQSSSVDDTNTPGFEIMLLVIAMIFVIISRKRKY